jgi:hypothetical protein
MTYHIITEYSVVSVHAGFFDYVVYFIFLNFVLLDFYACEVVIVELFRYLPY